MSQALALRPWLATVALCAALVATSPAVAAQPRRPAPKPRPAAPPAAPEPAATKGGVEVTVVEVAGGRVYLQPGTKGAVRRNAVVTIKGKEYRVLQASDSFAVIDPGADVLHEKDKGRASVVEEEEEKSAELPPPQPLSTWHDAWAPEAAPAAEQQPRFVPLGEADRNRRYDVTLSLASGAFVPLGSQAGSGILFAQIGARIHAEPFAAPMALDFDGGVQQWAAADLSSRVGGTTRSTVYVRELVASYATGGWYAGLGRLRYAASTLGTLDGGRVQAPLGAGFSVAAFGGVVPNPLGGEVLLDTQRFGVEARYSRPDVDLRPEAALVVHGSTFQGALDERRISGMFSFYPGLSRFGGHFEVSGFDANNPWKANPVELTGAGLDQSVRLGPVEITTRIDLLQPERSRWLATFLPTSWFCTTVPAAGGVTPVGEPCAGFSSTRALESLTAGLTLGSFTLAVGGTGMEEVPHTGAEPHVYGAFATARVVRIARYLRLEASGSYSSASYLDMAGGTFGPGLTLLDDALDLSTYYRVSTIQYASDTTVLLQNGGGAMFVVMPGSTLSFSLQGEGTTGNDVRSLFVFGTAAWRPRL